METLALLAQGFAVALTPDNIIWSIIGAALFVAIISLIARSRA